MGFFRPTYAEIDLNALEHNFRAAKACLSGNSAVMAMVKADAYGHGAVQVSKRLEKCGVAALGVATVEEGLELRDSGIKSQIIVMGGLMGMGSSASGMMVGADLTPVVHSAEVLEFLEAVSHAANKVIDIHLKIDSGMGRLGALPKSVDKLLETLKGCGHIRLEGVMTHFAEAEDHEYTAYQMGVFGEIAAKIKEIHGPVKIWHVANSAAMIDGRYVKVDKDSTTWVRPGIILYGSYPTPSYRKKISLKPVMSIKSAVALIKTVPAGTKVSYDCTYTTTRVSKLGVIPIGYADGYPWALSNKGFAIVSGKRAPIVGRVTMDMIVVDLTDIDVHIGAEVVLLGSQGSEEVCVEEVASLAGSIPYEIFCGISKRMPRVYLE